MNKFILLINLFFISLIVKAESYQITINWDGMNDSTIYLAHYYDVNVYKNDSLTLDAKGKGVFKGDSLLKQGLYLIYLNEKTYFDFLIGEDQKFEIHAKKDNLFNSITINGSTESEDFRKYQQFIMDKSKLKNELQEKVKSQDSTIAQNATHQMNILDKEMQEYLTAEILRTKGTMYSLFLKTSNNQPIPEPPFDKSLASYDSLSWFYYYNYRRDHFLDHLELKDERILNTPLVKSNLDTYFNKVLIQSPDSIIPQAIKLIRKSEVNKYTYQYVSQFLLNNSLQSKIMGMDAVFVAVADEVYLKGKATWIDSTTFAKIREEAYLIRQNIIGKKAPELVMENIDGEIESLHQSVADYTILVFYEYDCGHCKKEVPELYNNVFLKFIDNNIDVYAVCTENDKTKWKEFVEKNQLVGWHHLWDPQNRSMFRVKYNLKTTPLLYLLDKDKKIIAKRIDNETLIKLLQTLLTKK
jgi:peroxiredoxin